MKFGEGTSYCIRKSQRFGRRGEGGKDCGKRNESREKARTPEPRATAEKPKSCFSIELARLAARAGNVLGKGDLGVAGILINFAPDENKFPLFVAIGNFDAVSVFGQSGNRKGDEVRVTCIKVVESERKSFGIPCEIIDPQVNLGFLVQHEPAIGVNVFNQACPEMGVEDAFNSPRIEIPVFPGVFENLTAVGFDPKTGSMETNHWENTCWRPQCCT